MFASNEILNSRILFQTEFVLIRFAVLPIIIGASLKEVPGELKRERVWICGSHNAFVIIIIARVERLCSTGYSDDKLMGLSLFPSHIAITNLVVGHTSILSSSSNIRPCLHAFRLPNSDPHESGLSWKEDKMCINSLGMFIFWEI